MLFYGPINVFYVFFLPKSFCILLSETGEDNPNLAVEVLIKLQDLPKILEYVPGLFELLEN